MVTVEYSIVSIFEIPWTAESIFLDGKLMVFKETRIYRLLIHDVELKGLEAMRWLGLAGEQCLGAKM